MKYILGQTTIQHQHLKSGSVMKRNTIVLLFVFFAIACSSTKVENQSVSVDDTLDIYLANWRKDSLGCLQLRSKKASYFLIEKMDLIEKTENQVVSILGTPNTIYCDGEKVRLKYYFGSLCDNGLINDSADFCWVEYVFLKSNGKVIDINHICL